VNTINQIYYFEMLKFINKFLISGLEKGSAEKTPNLKKNI